MHPKLLLVLENVHTTVVYEPKYMITVRTCCHVAQRIMANAALRRVLLFNHFTGGSQRRYLLIHIFQWHLVVAILDKILQRCGLLLLFSGFGLVLRIRIFLLCKNGIGVTHLKRRCWTCLVIGTMMLKRYIVVALLAAIFFMEGNVVILLIGNNHSSVHKMPMLEKNFSKKIGERYKGTVVFCQRKLKKWPL